MDLDEKGVLRFKSIITPMKADIFIKAVNERYSKSFASAAVRFNFTLPPAPIVNNAPQFKDPL
jgi:hypothetical protein